MGKGKNKNKEKDAYEGPRHKGRGGDSDSEESIGTHVTFDDDLRSVQGDVEEDVDTIMDALSEHIENASHKNVSIRVAALKHLHIAFTSRYLPDFILKWKVTLVDLFTKNLRKPGEEFLLSANLLAIMAIQVGNEISDDVMDTFALLRVNVMNTAFPEGMRGSCAISLALITHLSCDDELVAAENLKALRFAWSNTKLGSLSSWLFSSALSGWALALQSVDSSTLKSALSEYQKITHFLEADQLDIRISCGEIIAFLYEYARERINENYRFPNHAQIIEFLESISSDSSKSKAKKDKRIQRFSFRQILACIAQNDPPVVTIKFSKEVLELDSCASKLFYDLCCEVLHGGLMQHLESNELLRDIFDLGPIPDPTHKKMDKLSRLAYHDAADKHRNQVRGKQRDKRSVVF